MPLLLALLLLTAGTAPAVAQERSTGQTPIPPEKLESYRAAVDLGVEEFRLGNYEEARSRFLEAHSTFPNARTLRALAKVEYELKRYLVSIDYAEQALASDVRPLTPTMRDDLQSVLDKARGYVATYTVQLDPPDASLQVDGQPVELGEDGQLSMTIGDHILEATAPEHHAARRTVTVTAQEDDTVHLRLLPLAERARPGADTEARDDTRTRKKRWLWTLGAVLVAGAATGLALGLRPSSIDSAEGGSSEQVVSIPQATFR